MIGPEVPIDIDATRVEYESSTWSSKITITLVSGEYKPAYFMGGGRATKIQEFKPDCVVALNAAVMQHQSWFPFLKMAIEAHVPGFITEPFMFLAEANKNNLEKIDGKCGELKVNPFRGVAKIFCPENNFEGFSNGFGCRF